MTTSYDVSPSKKSCNSVQHSGDNIMKTMTKTMSKISQEEMQQRDKQIKHQMEHSDKISQKEMEHSDFHHFLSNAQQRRQKLDKQIHDLEDKWEETEEKRLHSNEKNIDLFTQRCQRFHNRINQAKTKQNVTEEKIADCEKYLLRRTMKNKRKKIHIHQINHL